MPATGVTFQVLDSRQAGARGGDLLALHDEVYGGADDGGRCASGQYARQFRVWLRQPGFVLATAASGSYLVGYACGMPLRPSTSWWQELTRPLPGPVTAEHPGRTFALLDLAVRASWRRQGIGRTLHDLVMRGRPEERATLTVPQDAAAARQAFRAWGWQAVARTRGRHPGAPARDVLLLPLAQETP